MFRFCIVSFLVLAFQCGLAAASGPYDGKWEGQTGSLHLSGKTGGFCDGAVTATITDNRVQGTITFGHATPKQLAGVVEPDGTFKGKAVGAELTGKFSGKSFDGQFSNASNCSPYRLTMERS